MSFACVLFSAFVTFLLCAESDVRVCVGAFEMGYIEPIDVMARVWKTWAPNAMRLRIFNVLVGAVGILPGVILIKHPAAVSLSCLILIFLAVRHRFSARFYANAIASNGANLYQPRTKFERYLGL